MLIKFLLCVSSQWMQVVFQQTWASTCSLTCCATITTQRNLSFLLYSVVILISTPPTMIASVKKNFVSTYNGGKIIYCWSTIFRFLQFFCNSVKLISGCKVYRSKKAQKHSLWKQGHRSGLTYKGCLIIFCCSAILNFCFVWICEGIVFFPFNLKSLKALASVVRCEKWRKHSAMRTCHALFVQGFLHHHPSLFFCLLVGFFFFNISSLLSLTYLWPISSCFCFCSSVLLPMDQGIAHCCIILFFFCFFIIIIIFLLLLACLFPHHHLMLFVCLLACFSVRLFIIISLSSCFCSCPSYGLGQCALLHQADK